MTRYTMPARSQGKLYAQRREIQPERDTHRWAFVHSLTPGVEFTMRKWLVTRLNCFHCDLQSMYTPPLPSMSRNDEAVEVDARGLNARDAVKALIKATGSNPHLSVCGWPFCLDDLGGVDDMERGMV